jgi:hypothetical protein
MQFLPANTIDFKYEDFGIKVLGIKNDSHSEVLLKQSSSLCAVSLAANLNIKQSVVFDDNGEMIRTPDYYICDWESPVIYFRFGDDTYACLVDVEKTTDLHLVNLKSQEENVEF